MQYVNASKYLLHHDIKVAAQFLELGLDEEQQLSAPPPKRRRPRNPTMKEPGSAAAEDPTEDKLNR